jgi:hypothetical protein
MGALERRAHCIWSADFTPVAPRPKISVMAGDTGSRQACRSFACERLAWPRRACIDRVRFAGPRETDCFSDETARSPNVGAARARRVR